MMFKKSCDFHKASYKPEFNQEILSKCIERAQEKLSKINDVDEHVLMIKKGEL